MEFDPQDLRATPGVKDQNGDYTTLPVYDAGIKLLLESFEKSTGMDAPSKKGELLERWHTHFHRRAGERVIDYCTRAREILAELKSEGIGINEEMAGWMLQTRGGLSESRLELLQTATEGDYHFPKVQTQMIRLFKKVHEVESRRGDRPGKGSSFSNNSTSGGSLSSWPSFSTHPSWTT